MEKYNDPMKAEKYIKEWRRKATKFFYDVEVTGIRFLTLEECNVLGWINSGIVIDLSNDLTIIPANKDLSDAGNLLIYKEGNYVETIPIIQRKIDLNEYYERQKSKGVKK